MLSEHYMMQIVAINAVVRLRALVTCVDRTMTDLKFTAGSNGPKARIAPRP